MSKLTFLDIETSENIGKFWRPGNRVSLSYKNIIQERVILCAAWVHDDEETVWYTDSLEWKKAPKDSPFKWIPDDRKICEDILDGFSESSILVHHNGNSFDVPWINGRCLYHGLPTIGNVRNLDTYRIAKKTYNLNSYRLDYLAKFLKVDTGAKMHTDYELWDEVLINRSQEFYDYMVDYNIQDVEVLRAVYKRLRPGMSGVVWANMVDDETSPCPNCGQTHKKLHKRGTVPNQKTYYHRYFCPECGTWARGPNLRQE